jgi:hypothetical protein
MHQALYVEEIICLICHQIYDEGRDHDSRNDLTAFGLTQTSFLSPAMDVHWASIRDYRQLFSVWVGRNVLEYHQSNGFKCYVRKSFI